jgi:hypothetical protein
MELFLNGDVLIPYEKHQRMLFNKLMTNWESDKSMLHTLAIYDNSAPFPPYMHFLQINIQGADQRTGDILLDLELPNPPLEEEHEYFIDLYEQKNYIRPRTYDYRDNWNISGFKHRHHLELIDRVIIHSTSNYFYLVGYEENINPTYPLIRKDTMLNNDEQKFCECVIHVAEKQPGQCNFERAWFEQRPGGDGRQHECYNPFAVCANSIGTTSRRCFENYDFNEFTDRQLETIANLKPITVADPFDRNMLINALFEHADKEFDEQLFRSQSSSRSASKSKSKSKPKSKSKSTY